MGVRTGLNIGIHDAKRIGDRMDTVRFVEDLLDIKLLDYQKKMIEYFDKHPDCTIQIPRGRSTPSWIQAYYMCKTIDKKE